MAETPTSVRLLLSRRRGFNLQELSQETNGLAAISCARPGPFGNPFMVDCYGREGAVDRFDRLMAGRMSTQETSTSSHYGFGSLWSDRRRILNGLPKLIGRNLGCWCPLPAKGEPDCCHAAVLLRLAAKAHTDVGGSDAATAEIGAAQHEGLRS